MKITKYEPDENEKRIKADKNLRVAAYCRVSTDEEEQLNSYKSMIDYYDRLIGENPDWTLYKIYADEGITGTKTKDRVAFMQMITDAEEDQFDMVLTKSISRFARNTVDTLYYVRKLKDKGIPIIFENENINTMSMSGEFMLTILASVAQQEVENTSANVKKGLYAKMSRGELVGFNLCLGYDYNPDTKSITVNKEEAKIVEKIFGLYASGRGGVQIARELNQQGFKTKRGNKWTESGVLGIIKNEKYVGDLKQGKTYTTDPITKHRVKNNNKSVYYVAENHHEPIIDKALYEKCHEILKKRAYKRGSPTRGNYEKLYAFSSVVKCGYCGKNYTRRCWHSGSPNEKVVWQCVTNTKKGKKHCPYPKGISEIVLEDAFIKSYNMFCGDNKESVDIFMQNVKAAIGDTENEKKAHKLDLGIKKNIAECEKILDLYLNQSIDKATYEKKYSSLKSKRDIMEVERSELQVKLDSERSLDNKIQELRGLLRDRQFLTKFDREIFECIVEKVIIGDYDEDGKPRPYNITFVYKTGYTDTHSVKKKKCSYNNEGTNKGISTIESEHVETVCLLSKLHEAKHHVNVKLDMDEMDLTAAESKVTYEEIKSYVAEHHDGMHTQKIED